jgi:hypothetical protein
VSSRAPWIVAGAAVIALLAAVTVTRRGEAVVHPDPRHGVNADQVMPDGMLMGGPGVRAAYAAARAVPGTLDGLYCHCDCSQHFGHRSLLTCFESDHGSQCDICMGEAVLAQQLAAQGNSLQQIRRTIDARFAR